MRIIQSDKIPERFFLPNESNEAAIAGKILADVKANGDDAVRAYAKKFDGFTGRKFELGRKEIKMALSAVQASNSGAIPALKRAARNIRLFAEKQASQLKDFSFSLDGATIGQKVIPLKRVGCYVPGGRYPLPSSALMSIIPARVAGVKEIVVCSPNIAAITIVAAVTAGADRIFSIGGIQAIGAMAYGTESVPKVDKIVGPGNKYVIAAKKEVYGAVGIDFIAGPSEIMIISDSSGNSELIAADLLAQAEHDPNAKVALVTTSRVLANDVKMEIKEQLKSLSTRKVAEAALRKGVIIVVRDIKEAAAIANRKAPEHLALQVKNPGKLEGMLTSYGSLFIGRNSAEVFGDYCSGINHILPTNGAARYAGGLSVRDFVKVVTVQRIEGNAPKKLIRTAVKLAEIEGLEAHRRAALARLKC